MRFREVLGVGFGVMVAFAGMAPGQERTAWREHELGRNILLEWARGTAADPSIDVTFYGLDIAIATSPPGITGTVAVRARVAASSTDSVFLDLADPMTVDSVISGSQPAPFTHTAGSLRIRLERAYTAGEPLDLRIRYHGLPVETGFGSFVFSTRNGVPWVWSLSQPYGARDWWPCKDHPLDKADSAEIRITCDSAFSVGSNGRLVSAADNGNGTKTWTWRERHPIATYLISVALTTYTRFTNWFHYAPGDSMPIMNFVTPEHLRDGLAQLPVTVSMLEIFSDLFGLYPFVDEKYGHAEFQRGGAMEHQTMTSATYLAFAEYVVAHELAHQWFGDMITCASWQHLWLNEGFATYSEALYFEARYGMDAYRNDMLPKLATAKTATGTLLVQDTSTVASLFNHALVYDKGAAVLHMLRHVLGDSLFFASLRAYATTPRLRFSTATTADFRSACEEVSGRDLGWFFSEWVEGEGYPRYSLTWSTTPAPGGSTLQVRIEQPTSPSTPPFFRMPLDLRCSSAARETTLVLDNTAQVQNWTLPLPFVPAAVELDPGRWVLADITLPAAAGDPPADVPSATGLSQNYPNPFNGQTRIHYHIGREGSGMVPVSLTVFDILGRPVARIVEGMQPPGTYDVPFDGSGLPSGLYISELRAGASRAARTMVLVR